VWGQVTRFRHEHVTKSGIALCWVVESTGGSACFMIFAVAGRLSTFPRQLVGGMCNFSAAALLRIRPARRCRFTGVLVRTCKCSGQPLLGDPNFQGYLSPPARSISVALDMNGLVCNGALEQ
jgi:hypothetical protein